MRMVATLQPVSRASQGLAEKRKLQLRAIQAAQPAADRGSIGQAICVLELGHCLLPRAVLHKALPQCLAARQQTEVRVRERKQRKKSEGRSATGAAATANPNPVVMLVMRLLAPMSVSNNRIAFTLRTMAQDDFVAAFRPVGGNLVQRHGGWDKEDRYLKGLRRRRGPAKISVGCEAPPPEENST